MRVMSERTPPLVSTGEAAKQLNVSGETIRRWTRAGIITPTSRTAIGHYARWNVDDIRRQLAEYEESRTSGNEPPTTGDDEE